MHHGWLSVIRLEPAPSGQNESLLPFLPGCFLCASNVFVILCPLTFSSPKSVRTELFLQSECPDSSCRASLRTRPEVVWYRKDFDGLWKVCFKIMKHINTGGGKCATVRVELPAHVEDKINVCYTFSSSFVCDVRDISALCCHAFMASRDKITSCYFLCWLFKIMSV